MKIIVLSIVATLGGYAWADEPLERLVNGNERYVQGKPQPRKLAEERAALTKQQQPYAIVLACADSRVAPEIVFDESLGKLFVVRVAGNVADPVVLGSIEYAAEHLHAHLLVILGHDGCGAVKATLDGGELSPNMDSFRQRIAPATAKVKDVAGAVRENVRLQMERATADSKVLTHLVAAKKLQIAGGVYHLDTGKVEWLKP